MVKNVLIIAKGTIVRYQRLFVIAEYVTSAPDNRVEE